MGRIAEDCNLDVDPGERARALHRVVRAMHDGHCPQCGHLAPSEAFYRPKITNPNHKDGPRHASHVCPKCKFYVTEAEAEAALAEFRPYLNKSAEVFLKWRQTRVQKLPGDIPIDVLHAEAVSFSIARQIELWLTSLGIDGSCAGDYYLEVGPLEDVIQRYTLVSNKTKEPIAHYNCKILYQR